MVVWRDAGVFCYARANFFPVVKCERHIRPRFALLEAFGHRAQGEHLHRLHRVVGYLAKAKDVGRLFTTKPIQFASTDKSIDLTRSI